MNIFFYKDIKFIVFFGDINCLLSRIFLFFFLVLFVDVYFVVEVWRFYIVVFYFFVLVGLFFYFFVVFIF